MSYCAFGRINRVSQEMESHACINLNDEFSDLGFFGGDYINTFTAMDIRNNAIFQKIVAFYAENADTVLFGWSNRDFVIAHRHELYILSELGGCCPSEQDIKDHLKRVYRYFI